MRKLGIAVVISAMSLYGTPASAQVGALGELAGTAKTSTGTTLAQVTVQLRDLTTNTIISSTTSSTAGAFDFLALNPGMYAVEVVNSAGAIVAASSAIRVVAGTTANISVVASAAVALEGAAGLTAAAVAAAETVESTAVALITAAAATGIAAAVSVNVASASQ